MAQLAALLKAAAVDSTLVRKRVRLRPGAVKLLSLLKGYNPDQPRDERGRWGDGGAAVAGSASSAISSAAGSMLDAGHLERLTPEAAVQLRAMYNAAGDAKPEFEKGLTAIAKEVGGTAMLPGLKGSDRATEKIAEDLGGNPAGLRDILRATIEVKTVDEAQSALAQIQAKYDVIKESGFRNTLTKDAASPDGYRDIKMNVRLDGVVGEIQINVPAMLSAKVDNHGRYEQVRSIMGKATAAGRAVNAQERATVDRLNSEMKSTYDKAFESAISPP